jgi:hypothetical protein
VKKDLMQLQNLWVQSSNSICNAAGIICRRNFHFVMGFVLELKNKNARPVKYAVAKNSGNSTGCLEI